mgnify:CR=1 FL=1|tara:strand:- start:5 stop:349 length:345 start_codon:yes stop_codon:yes gene_type:complete
MNEEIIESDKDRMLWLEGELLESRAKIVELEAKTKTTLTGSQFLTIVLVGPLFLAFVTLGVLIVWKTTSKPQEIAPHLDIILVAFAIFANPVTAAAGMIVSLMSDEIKSKIKDN